MLPELERHNERGRPDAQVLRSAAPGRLKFGVSDGFHHELRQRVDRYFSNTGRTPRDCPQMYLKTAIILGWLAASYVSLVFLAGSWWLALPLALSLGLLVGGGGVNIQQHRGG